MAGTGGKLTLGRYDLAVAMTSRSVGLVVAAVVLLLMVGTFLTYRLREPPTRHVDGHYVGSCGAMIIANKTASFDGSTARFRLVFDKFGLVGWLDRPLGAFYVPTLDGRREPGTLIFDKNTVTALRFDQQACVFNRVR
jgi:hypothetical protein